jgi:hypothetical protein
MVDPLSCVLVRGQSGNATGKEKGPHGAGLLWEAWLSGSRGVGPCPRRRGVPILA